MNRLKLSLFFLVVISTSLFNSESSYGAPEESILSRFCLAIFPCCGKSIQEQALPAEQAIPANAPNGVVEVLSTEERTNLANALEASLQSFNSRRDFEKRFSVALVQKKFLGQGSICPICHLAITASAEPELWPAIVKAESESYGDAENGNITEHGCNLPYHRQCLLKWLTRKADCPICHEFLPDAKLEVQVYDMSEDLVVVPDAEPPLLDKSEKPVFDLQLI